MKLARRRRRENPRRILLLKLNRIVRESGNPQNFNSADWLRDWLACPCPALGHRRPADFLGTGSGRRLVLDMIERMQSGAYG